MIFRFLLGLFLGSFLSAFTYRYPRKIQFLKGRSFCDNCKKEIAWYDNIPVLSFLILGGCCRHCHKKISFRYPLIELATGIGFLLAPRSLGVVGLILFLILFAIFIIDFEHQIIPDSLIFLGLILNTLYSIQYTNFLAGFLAAILLLAIHLATRGRGMGLGDVKFAVLGGALVGLENSVLWLMLSFLTGAVVSIILILWRKKKLKDKIAFGPFLVISIPASLWLSSSSLFQSFLF